MDRRPGCIPRGAWDGSCCLWIDGFPGPLTRRDSSNSPPSPSSQQYKVPHFPDCSGNLDHHCCNTTRCTCRPGALPSPYPDCGTVVYAGDKRTIQKFTPIWFIFHLKNSKSPCIFLIPFFFSQGWASAHLPPFSGLCGMPCSATWRRGVAGAASRQFCPNARTAVQHSSIDY